MSRRNFYRPYDKYIYIPRTLDAGIELPAPRLKGIVTVERFRGDHRYGVKTGHWEFENLIVNGGLDLIIPRTGSQITAALSYMAVGTGSTAPANTDTGLQAPIAPDDATNRTNSNGAIADVFGFGASFAYAFMQRVRLFTETQSNGNLTEMGWFTAASAGTMFSRMLFKDGGGTPTTIVKTSADQLRVTYEIRLYPPAADATGSITISGTLYNYTIRAAETDSVWGINLKGGLGNAIGDSSGISGASFETDVLGATTAEPTGIRNNADTVNFAVYTNGNFFVDADYKWEPGNGNFATGIGSIIGYGGNSGGVVAPLFQMSFSPKINKDSTKRLTLTMRHTIARHP